MNTIEDHSACGHTIQLNGTANMYFQYTKCIMIQWEMKQNQKDIFRRWGVKMDQLFWEKEEEDDYNEAIAFKMWVCVCRSVSVSIRLVLFFVRIFVCYFCLFVNVSVLSIHLLVHQWLCCLFVCLLVCSLVDSIVKRSQIEEITTCDALVLWLLHFIIKQWFPIAIVCKTN